MTFIGRGVIPGGLQVTAQGVPDGTVQISAGTGIFNDTSVSIPASPSFDILTAHPADPSLDRYDIIGATSSGTITLVVGTPGKLGPTGDDSALIPFAHIRVGAGVTTITPSAITDVRSFIELPEPANTMIYTFVSGAQLDADPGTGRFAFDSATNTSITKMFINYSSPTWPVISGKYTTIREWLKPISYPCYFRLWSRHKPNLLMIVKVTALTHNTTYATLNCTIVSWTGEDIGAVSANPPFTMDALDVVMEYAGLELPTAALNGTSAPATDITLSIANTFFDGPTTGSIGANGQTLLLIGYVTVFSTVTGHVFTVKIWDGTTVFSEAEIVSVANVGVSIDLHALVSPAAAATYRISVASDTGTTDLIKTNTTKNSAVGNLATRLSWVRLS